MNKKLRPAKSAQQIKDQQIGWMLEEIEQDIEQFEKIIDSKNKQLFDLKTILNRQKVAIKSWQKKINN